MGLCTESKLNLRTKLKEKKYIGHFFLTDTISDANIYFSIRKIDFSNTLLFLCHLSSQSKNGQCNSNTKIKK